MDKFKELTEKCWVTLKPMGYKKKGQTFYITKSGNWGLINLQKRKMSGNEFYFTINIGICSAKVREFINQTSSQPDVEACQLRWRVGELMPKHEDHWWHVVFGTDIEDLYNREIESAIVDICVSTIDGNVSDEGIEKALTNRKDLLIGEQGRFLYLTTLLKLYNRPNLTTVANEFWITFKDDLYAERAEAHLKRLGVKPFENFFE